MSEDFPLRGVLACGSCGGHLTAGWSKGRTRHYAYYTCQARGCAMKGKSARREVVEERFEDLLRDLQPKPALFKVAFAMLKRIWNERSAQSKRAVAALKSELAAAEKQIAQLVERILSAEGPSLITAYETKIAALQKRVRTGPG